MSPIRSKSAIARLRKICKDSGLELTVNAGLGKGSHQSVIITDPKSCEHVRIIVTEDEWSPVVQRSILRHLTTMGGRVSGVAAKAILVEAVRQIFKTLFDE